MGIRGFTSFVDSRNSQLLEDHELHSTRVVIDGNNLYHFLYYYLHVKYQYGGDYDIFYKKVRDIFQMFLDSNVKPFVVFDGGYEADGKKLKTVLNRAKNRLHLAGHISHGGRGQILPILVEETFQTILVDMEIPFVVCDFEADAEIVRLANEWKCPVMSNDSDFFVFDLKGGFILFDYADFRMSSAFDKDSCKTYNFLPVQLYHVDNFVKVFPGFDKSLLPVIAILLGNDFIESDVFEDFFQSLKSVGSKTLPQKHRRLVSIISWLEEMKTCEEAVDCIVLHLRKHKTDLKQLIHKCISFYTDFEKSFSLSDCFDVDREAALTCHTQYIKMYNGTLPPSWFLSQHRSGSLHPSFLNITILHQVVLLSQVENLRVPSVYSTSVTVRQVIYGILLKEDLCLQKDGSTRSQATHILEYTRDECKNLKKTLLEPVFSISNFGELPGLSQVLDVPRDRQVEILLEVLCVPKSLLDRFCPPLQLLVCVIVYWISHSQPRVTKHHYHALLVSIILLQAKARIRQIKHRNKSSEDVDLSLQCKEHEYKGREKPSVSHVICVQSACLETSEGQLTSALQKLDRHHGKFQPITNTNPVDSAITHGYSQFQACLYDCGHLNKLLQSPLVSPKPHTFFSGVFLYNFTRELKTRSKPAAYVSDVFGTKSPLGAVFLQMDNAISEYIHADAFQETTTGKKNSKKKGKKGVKACSGCSSDDSSSSDDLPEMVQAACEVDNRFSCLLLEDA